MLPSKALELISFVSELKIVDRSEKSSTVDTRSSLIPPLAIVLNSSTLISLVTPTANTIMPSAVASLYLNYSKWLYRISIVSNVNLVVFQKDN